jgi:hypothetical protein
MMLKMQIQMAATPESKKKIKISDGFVLKISMKYKNVINVLEQRDDNCK